MKLLEMLLQQNRQNNNKISTKLNLYLVNPNNKMTHIISHKITKNHRFNKHLKVFLIKKFS